MAKAVTEVALGAAAIGAAILIPGAGAFVGAGLLHTALISMGASEVMAGIASAMQSNHAGIAVAVTTPAGNWGYVYGTQKVGGIEIFRESNNNTGVSGSTSNNKQLHRVYVLACHPCQIGSFQLRIDGKQVLLNFSGSDYVSYSPTQLQRTIVSISRSSGVVTMVLSAALSDADGTTLQMRSVADNTFNGTYIVTQPNPADPTTFTYVCGGPDASTSGGFARTTYSDYKDKIRVSFLNGNHTSTFPTLLAAGTSWKSTDLCLGHTLVYVQMGYDEGVFPSSIPNVSFVIDGKSDILDPRTGMRGFTSNAALCIADFLSMSTKRGGFGLAIGTDIPNAPLIAAANICDESVNLAGGGTTPRYTCDTFFQLDQSRGAVLGNMLTSCSGRITYQGGQYSIVPGAWVTPTLQLTDADLVGPLKWTPRLSIRDTANSIKGTYVSPENAYQIADVPAYMLDADHGFVTDTFLAEDNGERIFKDANFPCTNSSAIAQRLEKIALYRLRNQGRGTLICNLRAYQSVALDVIELTHPRYTWLNKTFEVLASRLLLEQAEGGGLRPHVELDVAETTPTGYDWAVTEQLTPQGYRQPQNVGVRICAPPENVSAYSGPGETVSGIVYPSTVTTGADGRVQNSIYVRWVQPNDAYVVHGGHLEVQYQPVGASTWTPAGGKIDPSADHLFIGNVSDGAQYDIQVRAVNVAAVPSDWIIVGPVTVSDALSSLSYSGLPVAPPGTLSAQAPSAGVAQITVANPFTARVGAATATCAPSPNVITGLNEGELYYVYYVDPDFAGGAITPIATQIVGDFEGLQGYFMIGQIVTPTFLPRYQPSRASDVGNSSTSNASAAYDNNVNTDAIVSASWWHSSAAFFFANGNCTWEGFPTVTLGASATLHVLASAASSAASGTWMASIKVTVAGAVTNLVTLGSTTAKTDYTMTIPSGTDLSTVSVQALVSIIGAPAGNGSANVEGFEIYIQ